MELQRVTSCPNFLFPRAWPRFDTVATDRYAMIHDDSRICCILNQQSYSHVSIICQCMSDVCTQCTWMIIDVFSAENRQNGCIQIIRTMLHTKLYTKCWLSRPTLHNQGRLISLRWRLLLPLVWKTRHWNPVNWCQSFKRCVFMVFPKQCLHRGVLTASVKAGAWSGCSSWSAAFYP